MDRSKELAAANEAVKELIEQLVQDGHDPQDLSTVFMGYSLQIMAAHHGRPAVAHHLLVVAERFADPQRDAFGQSASRH